MQRYGLSQKIGKAKHCIFFRGWSKQTNERVVVKQLPSDLTWQDILGNRSMSLMSRSANRHLAKIIQIFKEDNEYYCVLQGISQRLDRVISRDLTKDEVLRVSRSLLQMVCSLTTDGILPKQLRPTYLFCSEDLSECKVAHLQLTGKDISKLDLVELDHLKYMPPEAVLTSNAPDARALVFAVGLLIAELILGRPLIEAETKMEYMYQLCVLFPEEQGGDKQFQQVMHQFNFSSEFISLLRQMLSIDRNERINCNEAIDAFQLIVANQQQFNINKGNKVGNEGGKNALDVEEKGFTFEFQKKLTLSSIPMIKIQDSVLKEEENVEDNTNQPLIIRQNQKKKNKTINQNNNGIPIILSSKNNLQTLRRPQLTNYAMNNTNLGVKLGINSTLFTENDE